MSVEKTGSQLADVSSMADSCVGVYVFIRFENKKQWYNSYNYNFNIKNKQDFMSDHKTSLAPDDKPVFISVRALGWLYTCWITYA